MRTERAEGRGWLARFAVADGTSTRSGTKLAILVVRSGSACGGGGMGSRLAGREVGDAGCLGCF